jgi:hypothetical protein
MLTKLTLAMAACAAALTCANTGRAADPAMQSVVAPRCADGSCVPRRLTNGFYPTTWRQWPVAPPAQAKPGVREGISAPSVELPSPQMETYLPEGVLVAPPPLDQGGTDGGFEPRPRDSIPGPPSGPTPPRGESPQGVPPELRSGTLRTPLDKQTPRRQRAIAGREINRPAAVLESLNVDPVEPPSSTVRRDAGANIPAALPNDVGTAQPLSPHSDDETPSLGPMARWTTPLRLPQEPTDPSSHAGDRSGRTNWSPSRAREAEYPAQPKAAINQPHVRSRLATAERAAFRQTAAGLNAPAAIYARTLASDSQQSAARAHLTIGAPQAPAVLAVRTVTDEGWNPSTQFRNPLRGAQAVSRVALGEADTPRELTLGDPNVPAEDPIASNQFDALDNPLR